MKDEEIARVAHEVNRAYCEALGDFSQPLWSEVPEWQRKSAINGVKFHRENPNAGPEHSHENWLQEKLADGWKFGVRKDPKLKTHPCIREFNLLPTSQRAKDYIFRSIVHALT